MRLLSIIVLLSISTLIRAMQQDATGSLKPSFAEMYTEINTLQQQILGLQQNINQKVVLELSSYIGMMKEALEQSECMYMQARQLNNIDELLWHEAQIKKLYEKWSKLICQMMQSYVKQTGS